MSFSDEPFLPTSHILVLGLLPVAFLIMLMDASRSIDLGGAGLPILMVTATVASFQWNRRRDQLSEEQEGDNG